MKLILLILAICANVGCSLYVSRDDLLGEEKVLKRHIYRHKTMEMLHHAFRSYIENAVRLSHTVSDTVRMDMMSSPVSRARA